MQKFCTLRLCCFSCAISLFLCFILVSFGCANGKNVSDFSVTAEGTSEGIVLQFKNIPENTTDISLTFVDINTKDQPETVVILNLNVLDEVKKTGNLLCPFAENGREYFIRVYRLIGTETAEKIVTGAVAGGGIYLINTPLLQFIDGNKTIALSEMPAFSDKVVFSTDEFLNYYTYVRRDNGGIIGIGGEAANSLTSSDSVRLNEDVAGMYSSLLTDNMLMYGTAHCLLEYGNMEWSVQVAQSEDIIVSF